MYRNPNWGELPKNSNFYYRINKGQALSLAFMNANIIVGLVYRYTSVEPMMAQTLDAKPTLLDFPEGEEVEKICSTL